jgi:hypothetical protein
MYSNDHQFFSSKEEIMASLKKYQEHNKNLNLEHEIAIIDEEHRIVRDWFKVGGVEVNDYVFEENQ